MYKFVYGVAVGTLGMFLGVSGNQAYGSQIDEAAVFLVQGSTGAGSGSQGLETGKSGTGKETDAGRGTMGNKSPFGSDQPTSGDFSPNPSSATRNDPPPTDKTRGSEQPAGIGEKGSGQTRSTTERSGGPQPSASESMSKSQHGEGKTERAAKEMQKQKPSNR